MNYVLIIDNDHVIRSVLAEKLKQAGIATQEAADGHEGLEKAKKDHPAVIILDEHMPHMNGQQFVEALQQEEWFEDVRIVVFTALNDIDLMNHKIIAGVSDYLEKGTSTPEKVVEIAQKYLQSANK
ncbi:MAG TPA: response regulator [Candidatus Saccharimonadales bacterium]